MPVLTSHHTLHLSLTALALSVFTLQRSPLSMSSLYNPRHQHTAGAQQGRTAAHGNSGTAGPRAAHSSRGATLLASAGRRESGAQQQPKVAQHGRPASGGGHAAQIYEVYFVSTSPIHLEAKKEAMDVTITRRGEQGRTSLEISAAAREDDRWPARWMRLGMRVAQMWGTRREERGILIRRGSDRRPVGEVFLRFRPQNEMRDGIGCWLELPSHHKNLTADTCLLSHIRDSSVTVVYRMVNHVQPNLL